MTVRFGINGLGRVGRALLRIAAGRPGLEVVAVNDLVPAHMLARLVARDSVHGPFPGVPPGRIGAEAGRLRIDRKEIPVWSEPEPLRVPWSQAGAEVVVEATGRFTDRALAAGHLGSGVRLVIVSANADVDETFCCGLNDDDFRPGEPAVISNASCTTNCLALVLKVLDKACGIERALLNTVHGYTESQRLLDAAHPDARRSRAAALNLVPVATTSARTVEQLFPQLAGRIEGLAVRVPTPAVALLDLVAEARRDTSAAELRAAFRAAAEGPLQAYLGVSEEELVSSDFVGDPRSAIVDLPLLQVAGGRLVRVMAWYDNEWGYANRLADLLTLYGERRGR
jgi:glyceraldehyde 3-phosphate dehydrogenase